MLVNHGSEANEPEWDQPEQPARTLANTAIVIRLEGVKDQQTDAQEQSDSLNGLHRRLSLQHAKERDQKNRRQTKDSVMPQQQVKHIEPFRFIGSVNATRGKPVAAFVLVVVRLEVEVVRQEAARGNVRRVQICSGNQDCWRQEIFQRLARVTMEQQAH